MTATPKELVTALIDRARHMIVSPVSEWDKVERETATIAGLYKNYALILAAIPAVFTLLALLKVSFGTALGVSVKAYLFSLAGTAAMAFLADFVAPKFFKGTASQIGAFKLVIYSATAAWVASVFVIVPVIGGIISFAGALYSLYLLYLGAPKLLKVPQDKAGIFTVVMAVTGALLMLVAGKALSIG